MALENTDVPSESIQICSRQPAASQKFHRTLRRNQSGSFLSKDLFRHGFVVGCIGDTYILYQEAGISEHWKKPYIYEVGRTNDIVEMENCLNKLANRYTDEDIFTLPLSLDAFTESTDAENLGKDFIMDDRTQLTQKEVENFYSGKKAMKKLEQYI